jgi:N-carbamoyl-L-amino-acid hydrolase
MTIENAKLSIPLESLIAHIDCLNHIGSLGEQPESGYLRASWSNEESAAMHYIAEVGVEHGMQVSYDKVGNLFVRTPGSHQRFVQVGSHLDTVPRGGAYDGAVGVIAGLEAIISLKSYWETLPDALQLVVWRGEESATFGAFCIGSKAAFGLNDPGILNNEFQGIPLRKAIQNQGFDPAFIHNQQPSLPTSYIDSLSAHFELHIEQAAVLEKEAKDIGIVNGLRGFRRMRILVYGQAVHSGGTPMGVQFRKDANLAIANMQVELDSLAIKYINQGEDLVQTVGIINSDHAYNCSNDSVYDNALTKVSPFGYFTLDIRSCSKALLSQYRLQVQEHIQSTASSFGVEAVIEDLPLFNPVENLDHNLRRDIEKACIDLGFSYRQMTSGGFHDVGILASQPRINGDHVPCALIFVPCRGGISHSPKEYTSPETVQKGGLVLASAMLSAAKSYV